MKQRILVIDDEDSVRDVLKRVLDKEGYEVHTAGNGVEGLEQLRDKRCAVTLVDMRMPVMDGMSFLERLKEDDLDTTVIMMSAYGEVKDVIKAIKIGAYYYVSKPFEMDEVLLIISKALEEKRLREENYRLKRELGKISSLEGIIGTSKPMKEIFGLVEKVKDYDVSVLISGESGTGKELFARALHYGGGRKEFPFVPVNCAALPENLIETELYGYKKGAFTDARYDKKGLIEEADGGTLFLDEISELPGPVQAKLLRFLQEGEIRRVGDTENRVVHTRVVTATSRDLKGEVAEGRFREDLFYRLNKVVIEIPPLRDRKEDIPILTEYFINIYSEKSDKDITGLSSEAFKLIMSYNWPGNVRELENLIERAVVMADSTTLTAKDLGEVTGEVVRGPTDNRPGFDPDDLGLKDAIKIVEKEMIGKALEKTGGNRPQAAKMLGISHPALLYKIKEYGIN